MQTFTVHRRDLQQFFTHVTDCRPDGRPLFPIFSVLVARREPLYLRYPPIDQYTNGPFVRVGDFNFVTDKGQKIIRNGERVFSSDVTAAQTPIYRRKGEKILLEPEGAYRWMVVKNWARGETHQGTRHWRPKGGSLGFNPIDHDLFLVMGMYNDTVRRHGQWRPFAMICLRSCLKVRVGGHEYEVID